MRKTMEKTWGDQIALKTMSFKIVFEIFLLPVQVHPILMSFYQLEMFEEEGKNGLMLFCTVSGYALTIMQKRPKMSIVWNSCQSHSFLVPYVNQNCLALFLAIIQFSVLKGLQSSTFLVGNDRKGQFVPHYFLYHFAQENFGFMQDLKLIQLKEKNSSYIWQINSNYICQILLIMIYIDMCYTPVYFLITSLSRKMFLILQVHQQCQS